MYKSCCIFMDTTYLNYVSRYKLHYIQIREITITNQHKHFKRNIIIFKKKLRYQSLYALVKFVSGFSDLCWPILKAISWKVTIYINRCCNVILYCQVVCRFFKKPFYGISRKWTNFLHRHSHNVQSRRKAKINFLSLSFI